MPSPLTERAQRPNEQKSGDAGCVEVVLGASGSGRHLGQRLLLNDDVHGRAGRAVRGDHLRPVAGTEQVHGAASRAARSVPGPPDPGLCVRNRGLQLRLHECAEARLGAEAVPVGVALLRIPELDVAVGPAHVAGTVPHDGGGTFGAVGLAGVLAFARVAVAVGLGGRGNRGDHTDQNCERGDDRHCNALHDLPISV